MNRVVQQLLPLPATKAEATAYLARLDQLVSAWSDDPGSGRMLGLLRHVSRAVEAAYPLLPG